MITLSHGEADGVRRDLAVQRVWMGQQNVVEFFLNGRVWAPPIQIGDLSHFENAITTQCRDSFLPFDQSTPVNLLVRNPAYHGHLGIQLLIHLWDTSNSTTANGVIYCDSRLTPLRTPYYDTFDGIRL